MRSILIRSRVGADGVLHLDVPSGLAETEVEVTVILQPITERASNQTGDLNWSLGFFESVVGGWEGEPLARANEAAYEIRERM
jgi:hypothetical protein